MQKTDVSHQRARIVGNATPARDKKGSPNNKLRVVPISATGKQPHY